MDKTKKLQYTLKNIPEDLWLYIKEQQYKLEADCKCAGSFEKTIYYLLKKYKKIIDQ